MSFLLANYSFSLIRCVSRALFVALYCVDSATGVSSAIVSSFLFQSVAVAPGTIDIFHDIESLKSPSMSLLADRGSRMTKEKKYAEAKTFCATRCGTRCLVERPPDDVLNIS